MAPDRRQQRLLALLVVVSALALVYWLWPRPAAPQPGASNVRGPARGAAPASDVKAPDVHLEALDGERPKPADADRDLFRFKPRQPPPPPPSAQRAPPPPDPQPTGPPPPPPLPPIPLKFIGLVEAPEHAMRVAMLSDGKGAPVYGKEGDTVLGQYKILRINTESIELAYLDGRGRQTIRLSGS